jgi:hypothetical protein
MSSTSSTRNSPSPKVGPLRAACLGILAAAVLSGLLHLAGYSLAAALPGLPLCPFKAVTGLPCPGCGITHAFLALGRLDLAGAWAANPLVFPLSVLVALCALGRTPRVLSSSKVTLPALAGVLVFWCFRLLPGLR